MSNLPLNPSEIVIAQALIDVTAQMLGESPTPAQQAEAINAMVFLVVTAARASKAHLEVALTLRRAAAFLEKGE